MWPVSAAPRRAAPRTAREPRARAPRTPRPARAGPSPALPRPGAGAARGRLPELGGRTRECEREGRGPLRRRRGGGAAGSPARRGGARRAALGAGLGAVSALTAELRGGASEDGHELRRQARRARARGAARLRSQPARRLRSPQNAWSSPGPRPSPLAPRRRRPPAHPGAGWCPEHGESALPGRPASRPPPPCPPRGWSGPLPHPRPALTCSLAQPQTLAVGSPRSLHAGRGRDGRGARGHGGWQCVFGFFFFFRVWGEGGVGGNRARP